MSSAPSTRGHLSNALRLRHSMYTHCLFCRADLARNDIIESLPIGRRIAFDAAKGRLWIVCPRCAQWNLTPFEERWEAVETAEKLYRDTHRRVQGDEIGLARLREGLELVRIGRPQRPEFAAWRYGDHFGRRRRELTTAIAGAAATGAAVLAAGPLLGVSVAGGFIALSTAFNVATLVKASRAAVAIEHPDGGRLVITPVERMHVRLVQRPESDGGWGLDVPFQRVVRDADPWWKRNLSLAGEGTAHLSGADAMRAAELLISRANPFGTRQKHIETAVSFIEDAGGPDRWFRAAAAQTRMWGAEQSWGDTGAINFLPKSVRLALEMAAHEESERRAIEGELAELEDRWREAEEIAAIADDLLVPAPVTRLLARLKGTRRG